MESRPRTRALHRCPLSLSRSLSLLFQSAFCAYMRNSDDVMNQRSCRGTLTAGVSIQMQGNQVHTSSHVPRRSARRKDWCRCYVRYHKRSFFKISSCLFFFFFFSSRSFIRFPSFLVQVQWLQFLMESHHIITPHHTTSHHTTSHHAPSKL